jgi:hypothetical protein
MRAAFVIALLGVVLCGCRGRGHGEQARAREPTSVSTAPEPSTRQASADSERYPVRWWEGLHLKSLNDAASLYASGDGRDFGELKLDGERVRPTNCADWARMHSQGYEPINTPEEQADNGAKIRCLTLSCCSEHMRRELVTFARSRGTAACSACSRLPSQQRLIVIRFEPR